MRNRLFNAFLILALLIPVLSVGVASADVPEGQDYTVQTDDYLWGLSEKYLGNGAAYTVIVIATNLANKEDASYAKIVDPALIQPGWKLRIPTSAMAEEYLRPPAAGELGSADKPVQLYFVPSVQAEVIVESGEDMAAWFKDTIGVNVEVKVPTSYAAVIEAMGASEGDIVGFIPAQAYVLANEKYGVDVALSTVRYGREWYATQYLASRDSPLPDFNYDTIPADYNGVIWAFPDEGSTSGYLFPKAQYMGDGVEPGKELSAGGHPQAALAVYDGSADVGTCYFSPPGDTVEDWDWGDVPEPNYDQLRVEEEDGSYKAYYGDLRVRDCRTAVLSTAPDIIEKVRIVGLSAKIPNDTVSFVEDFPPVLRYKLVQALLAYADTEHGQEVLGNDEFYDITGFAEVDDSTYDPVRDLVTRIGIDLEEKYGLTGGG